MRHVRIMFDYLFSITLPPGGTPDGSTRGESRGGRVSRGGGRFGSLDLNRVVESGECSGPGPSAGSGLHSSTSQLNLSRF